MLNVKTENLHALKVKLLLSSSCLLAFWIFWPVFSRIPSVYSLLAGPSLSSLLSSLLSPPTCALLLFSLLMQTLLCTALITVIVEVCLECRRGMLWNSCETSGVIKYDFVQSPVPLSAQRRGELLPALLMRHDWLKHQFCTGLESVSQMWNLSSICY